VRKGTKIAVVLLTMMHPSIGIAMSDVELHSLRTAIIEMCRGGTLTGSGVHVDAKTKKNIVTISGLLEDKTEVTLKADEWNGIQAFIQNPNKYTECTEYALGLLVPVLENKKISIKI